MNTLQDFYDALPNLRNGNPNTYTNVHVAAGIAREYHTYAPDVDFGYANNIRSRVRLMAAHYAGRLMAATVDAAKARAYGIILACVRVGIYTCWAITKGELVASQVIPDADANVDWDAAKTGDERSSSKNIRDAFDSYTEEYVSDKNISDLMRIGMGMLPCTGVVLVRSMNEHHFVDPHKSIHRAVLGQVLGRRYDIPFGLTKAEFEDVVCHKSAHCVNTAIAVSFARRAATRTHVQAANLASAGVRIPALYPSEQAASAVRKVAEVGSALGKTANVVVDVSAIRTATEDVTVNEMSTAADRTTSASRQAALVSKHGHDIAFCAGMIMGMAEHTGSINPPVLTANSIQNIIAENPAAVSNGKSQIEQANTVQRNRARRGIVSGVGLFGAAAPPDTEPLPADDTLAQILAAVFSAKAGSESTPVP